MELINYFLVIALFQIALISYLIYTGNNIQLGRLNKRTLRIESLTAKKNENLSLLTKTESQCSGMDMEKELKRNRKQLRRHLMTLNYLSKLESSNIELKDIAPIVDMINIKEKLHREVIRNAKLVKHYESMVA